jgi:hypothetical protein
VTYSGGVISPGILEAQGVEAKTAPAKSVETNGTWAGLLITGVYEYNITGGTANEHDHIELSGFSNFAKGN